MSAWHRVATLQEIPVGTSKEVTLEGRILALCHTADGWHVMDGICPHAGGPLGKGQLHGCIVTCPWHGWQFNVVTGTHTLTPRIQQALFEVKIEDEQIFVQVE